MLIELLSEKIDVDTWNCLFLTWKSRHSARTWWLDRRPL